jgi:hypothetical protein
MPSSDCIDGWRRAISACRRGASRSGTRRTRRCVSTTPSSSSIFHKRGMSRSKRGGMVW